MSEKNNEEIEAGDYPMKKELYKEIKLELKNLVEDERDWLANLANTAALIFQRLPGINWAGFYLCRQDKTLLLGPFQGRPACTRIPPGEGVCGTALVEEKTLVVPDVHDFPGHIACDPRSKSEIVIPLKKSEKLIGVLDIDSPQLERFDSRDAENLEELTEILLGQSEFVEINFNGGG
ncbi:GAF domain-containing protein [Halarsenatibacter silvermanii]|uniref:GAF domain-containing protein n=1 Tax=Halarsenatibacter silvermanii TaxID=321763 RepID=A0A1G9I2N7_9FIRM|nr:GAF domain-containing protein [Halarsenatibacter silvermanii]